MKKLLVVLLSFSFLQPVFAEKTPVQTPKEIPVLFRENKGQMTDVNGKPVPFVLFEASAKKVNVFITRQGLTYVFSQRHNQASATVQNFNQQLLPEQTISTEWLNVQLEGAQIRPENILKEGKAATDYRYFYGHCPNGITGVRDYEKITVKDVWPGIDWVLYGSSEAGMKYDFIVHPGGDPNNIRLVYEGDRQLELDSKGNIRVAMRLGELTENAPESFTQDRQPVTSAFHREPVDDQHVRITYTLGNYPKDQQLIIDPQLVWGTTYGGSDHDAFTSNTHDSNGAIFVTGYSASVDFPVMNTGTYFQGTVFQETNAVILKFDTNGVLVWATYYGGNSADMANSVTCDSNNNVFVAGTTTSANFPVLDNGTWFQGSLNDIDAFILKFDNDGNRLWATYYGGFDHDNIYSITCDAAGNLFATGMSTSDDFPLLDAGSGAWFQSTQTGPEDIVFLKFDNNGNRLWATYYGGTTGAEQGYSITCDPAGNIYATGRTEAVDFPLLNNGGYFQGTSTAIAYLPDAFLLKFTNTGVRLWSTFYGGSVSDGGISVRADADGNIFVSGITVSNDLPVYNAGTYFDNVLNDLGNMGVDDMFLLKFDSNCNRLWATYYGGNTYEWWSLRPDENLAIDKCGNVYICFATFSDNIETRDPGNGSYFDGSFSGEFDHFLACFSNSGEQIWGTYLGKTGYYLHITPEIDDNNSLYVSGCWEDASGTNLFQYPGNGAFFDNTLSDVDGFMLKFANVPASYTTTTTVAGCDCSGTGAIGITGSQSPFDYSWSTGAVTTSDSPGDTLTGLCAGNYQVTVSSCYDTDTIYFTIDPGTTPIAGFVSSDTLSCGPFCSHFLPEPLTGVVYSWDFGDGFFSGLEDPIHCYTNPGTYDVTLIVTANGCADTLKREDYIHVHPVPEAAFSVSMTTVPIHDTVYFTEEATGEYAWSWNFGDAIPGQSDEPNPSYTYSLAGSYPVSLVVTNEFFCTDTARMTLVVFDDFGFYVPNTFTPNNNGINETWFAGGTEPRGFEMTVFNRWGEIVWETKEWGDSWNGNDAQDGVYVWRATLILESGSEVQYTGHVALIR